MWNKFQIINYSEQLSLLYLYTVHHCGSTHHFFFFFFKEKGELEKMKIFLNECCDDTAALARNTNKKCCISRWLYTDRSPCVNSTFLSCIVMSPIHWHMTRDDRVCSVKKKKKRLVHWVLHAKSVSLLKTVFFFLISQSSINHSPASAHISCLEACSCIFYWHNN